MSQTGPSRRIETRSVHVGRTADPSGAVAPAIHLSTTFERDDSGELRSGFIYGRSGNPDRVALETVVADLEGGAECIAFGSGTAAIHSVLYALAPGDLVLAPRDAYHGTMHLLSTALARWGLRTRFTDFLCPDDVDAGFAAHPALALVETPSNPMLRVTDIGAVAARCRASGALLAVDNTWMTPVLQRPLEHGADLVVHSTTKYFGGHSDVTGGTVVARRDLAITERIRAIQTDTGPVPSPFDAWLLRRGVKTLPLRIRAQSKRAAALAGFLAAHPRIAETFYPGLSDDPGHAIQSRQADGFGAMLSFRVRGGEGGARRFMSRLRLLVRATSLGGVETLAEHRFAVEGPTSPTPRDLIRVSVGLEHPADLIADLEQALA